MPRLTLEEVHLLAREASSRLEAIPSPQSLEEFRLLYLGRKGKVAQFFEALKELSADERRTVGHELNKLKTSLERKLDEKKSLLSVSGAKERGEIFDATLPGIKRPYGRIHPLTQMIREITAIFERLGFEVVEGPEVENEFHNFTALNIPADHPSRDSFATFYVQGTERESSLLLRSQTSTVQIRVMQKRKPPLRMVAPGRVYRPDPVDASHSFMFHQIEGLMVDDHTTFSDLKGVIHLFLRALFGEKTRVRFRPHHFPFTEPSVEVDLACFLCAGQGCSVCGQKGWLEIMGAGSVHPFVFETVGYDPKKVQGFAFGMGVERLCMLRYGIDDIRLFFENDLRFLDQF